MKKYIVLLSVLAVLGFRAEAQQAKTESPKVAAAKTETWKAVPSGPEISKAEATRTDMPLQSATTQIGKKRQSLAQDEKPNEILKEKVGYSGIAVQLVKTDNPVQLISPAAPAKYGSPEDNTLRNPIDNKVLGLKIFAIKF